MPIPQTNGDHHVNGDAESATSGNSRGKDHNPNRLSFFRGNGGTAQPLGEARADNGTSKHNETVVEHALPGSRRRKSSDISRTLSSKENDDPNAAGGGERKAANVRKRLSILKLGKKSSKGSGFMGSLDEE